MLKKLYVDPADIVSIGVTNQRETVVVWVGEVVAWWVMNIIFLQDCLNWSSLYPAIVWPDLRTRDMVTSLNVSFRSSMVQAYSNIFLTKLSQSS